MQAAGALGAPGATDVDICDDVATAAVNSLFVWRLIRKDERVKVFRCLTALTELLGRVSLPAEDPERAPFCEVFVYLTRPRAMRLPEGMVYAIFLFNRERRYCAAAKLRGIANPDAPDLFALTFYSMRRAPSPEDSPDPTAETLPREPAMADVTAGHAEPACAPLDPKACCPLGPGAWWHIPERRIYCWMMDESLLSLCPPGWRVGMLGRLVARVCNHESGCEDCTPEPHVDSVNAMWGGHSIADACPCVAPCAWNKMARRHVPIRGDASLSALLFSDQVDVIVLLGSSRTPKISDRLHEVIGGCCGHDGVQPNERGWRLYALSPYASVIFATSCPAISRVVYNTDPQ
ncbi:hypothetical protein AMR77_25440 [Escherichia coli]|uniref:Tegument protein UL16 n=1 Tax=Bovine alphaherpesvirus 2 TaxID=10295 RepID=A0A7T1L7I4_9ALPH|nr:hypothetical protein AMR77_25440 [Escherichia coli]QPO25225.1 tegument protein UL16 [Bovine alphaherpesvirus 2]